MKKIIPLMLLAFSATVFADQCQLVSKTMVKRASLLLQPGAEIASLCQPCGDVISDAKVSVVRNTKIISAIYSTHQEISINNRTVDLAYTYVKIAPNRYANVAKVIGCQATGVSEIISK